MSEYFIHFFTLRVIEFAQIIMLHTYNTKVVVWQIQTVNIC